jgi:long-subunit fatty acid transport protein
MKLLVATGVICTAGVATAGGLFLPGAGAISTSRAGASLAAANDGEALVINPADLGDAPSGTFIQLGIAAIDYFMSFHRNGSYDAINEEAFPYEGSRFPTVTNDAKPPLGIGSYQPVPLLAVVTDFGGRVPGLRAAFGLYAPNAYPFREMNTVNGKPFFIPNGKGSYDFPASYEGAPPPTRYDVIHEEAAIILPSIAVSYRALPQLDVGARVSAGTGKLNSTVAVWGLPGNYEEYVKQDGIFTLDASGFVYNWQLGGNFHATPNIDLAAQYTAPIYIHAQGDAISTNGPAVTLNGAQIVVTPYDNKCAAGQGTTGNLRGCVDVELPMTATLGGRYKFLDDNGALKGDLELDVGWEHWGASCDYTKDPTCLNPSDFHVTVNAQVGTVANPDGIPLKPQFVSHGFQDTYSARLGGSWSFPVGGGANSLIARGGVGYDSAAAKPGWERADFDGAARTMLAAGASYKMNKIQIDAGFAVILEGTRTDDRTCNPTAGAPSATNAGMGCAGTPGYTGGTPGTDNPVDQRHGPDPINPIVVSNVQAENPVNEGTFKSHYLFFMLGASYHF